MSHLSSAATRSVSGTVRSLHGISFVPPSTAVCCHRMYCVFSATRPPSGKNCLYGLAAAGPMSSYLLLFKKAGKNAFSWQAAAFWRVKRSSNWAIQDAVNERQEVGALKIFLRVVCGDVRMISYVVSLLVVPWHRDFSIVQFNSPRKDLLYTSRHLGTVAEQSLTATYYGKRNVQHVFASQACTFILAYNKYRVVTIILLCRCRWSKLQQLLSH